MKLAILDVDCCNDFSPEEIRKWLDGQDLRVFCLDGMKICSDDMRLEVLFDDFPKKSEIEKAVFLTRMRNGLMGYHTRILSDNPQMYWIVSILDMKSSLDRDQCLSGYDMLLYNKNVRYEILFENTSGMCSATAKVLKEQTPPDPFFVVATEGDYSLTEELAALMKRIRPDATVSVCPDDLQSTSKYAERILLAGRKPEDFVIEPIRLRTNRVYLWLETGIGRMEKDEEEKLMSEIRTGMEEAGWNLSDYRAKTLTGISAYESLLCDLEEGKIGAQALQSVEEFVMWDIYGLPVKAEEYEELDKVQDFLRSQCCLRRVLENADQV